MNSDLKEACRSCITGDHKALFRNLLFLLLNLVIFVFYTAPIGELLTASFDNELYSHIFLVPLVSSYFILQKRRIIFADVEIALRQGMALTLIGIALFLLGMTWEPELNKNDYFSLMMLSAVMSWVGGFVIIYGTQASRKAVFPLLFLILMVPIPTLVLDKIIILLQIASAEVSYGVFTLSGVPVFRDGFVFHLPGLNIEVAEQCSGIRSTLALFIASIVAGHLFLKTGWRKVVLTLSIFPITVFKNGLRIVTLSLLGAYVDIKILTQSLLHSRGGIPFLLLAFMFMLPVLIFLMRSEKRAI